MLNPEATNEVAAYASGIHYRQAERVIPNARLTGFNAFKIKVGFDADREMGALKELLSGLDEPETLAADANQAWNLAEARAFLAPLNNAELAWIEEPLPAYASPDDWQRLAQTSSIPLAGGENITGYPDFLKAISCGSLAVLQPDVIKWGGITGCAGIAHAAIKAKRRYCPHYLGGGVGLAASAEVLAAAGGDGQLEVDVNPNPLREEIVPTANHLTGGMWHCSDRSGLGIEALPNSFNQYQTHSIDLTT
jgi:L-alanine-DL-glutamate epimerase-like enolase superfamily enzyme